MDSEETKRSKREKEIEGEKINKDLATRVENLQKLMDSAYTLFDGKYSMVEIREMPYRILLSEMEREQKNVEKNSEQRANKKMEKDMKKLGI